MLPTQLITMERKLPLLLCATLLGACASQALAQSSANSISFQGALTRRNGQPLPNGNYDLVFKFYTTKGVPASKLVRRCCWEPRV